MLSATLEQRNRILEYKWTIKTRMNSYANGNVVKFCSKIDHSTTTTTTTKATKALSEKLKMKWKLSQSEQLVNRNEKEAGEILLIAIHIKSHILLVSKKEHWFLGNMSRHIYIARQCIIANSCNHFTRPGGRELIGSLAWCSVILCNSQFQKNLCLCNVQTIQIKRIFPPSEICDITKKNVWI